MSSSRGLVLLSTNAARLATWVFLGFAALALGLWQWSLFCEFPGIAWNDVRLAPTIALARGFSIYPTPTDGVINTWTYGPLPVLSLWPASWASSPEGALLIAGGLNLAVALGSLAFVCFAWPIGERDRDTCLARALAFVLCAVLWPEWQYLYYVSDNLAIACGLIGSTLLVRAQGRPLHLWAAAALAIGAVACKQIAFGIGLAHLLWLALTVSMRAALEHVLRCAAVGMLAAAAAIATFGAAELWFVLVALPARFGWTSDFLARVRDVSPSLLVHLAVPPLALLIFRRSLLRGELLLPSLLWLCSLPLGLAALLKTGGRMNSIYSFVLWLPPVITWLVAQRRPFLLPLAASVAALSITARLALTPRIHLQPQTILYAEARGFAPQLRERVWFPLHPLITLYTDQRYYHDEDGLYVRSVAKLPLTRAQIWSHLPRDIRVIALPEQFTNWGIAQQLLPPGAEKSIVGRWALWHGGRPPATP